MTIREPAPPDVIAQIKSPPKRRPQAPETQWRTPNAALQRMAWTAAICVASVGATVALIDRPVASWVHEHLVNDQVGWFMASYAGLSLKFGPFTLMASPAEALRPLAALVFVGLATFAFAGWRPGSRGRIVFALCISIFASTEINGVLKEAFGRTWPESWLGDNPSWIRDGVFGFSPFHGGLGWGSFPSGHTAIIAAPAAVLWQIWPSLRGLWAGLVAIIVAGLIFANYHFVSDTIAGLFVGAGAGLAVAKLTWSSTDRPIRLGGSK